MLVCSLLSKDPIRPILVQSIDVFYGAITHFIDINPLSSFTKVFFFFFFCTTAVKYINSISLSW